MNGAHDLGGMHGFGPVVADGGSHVRYATWEYRTHALLRVALQGGLFNVDEFRHAIERLNPAEYLASSYYERWQKSIERLLVEKGVVTSETVSARMALLRDQPNATLPEPPPTVMPGAGRVVLGVPTMAPLRAEPGFREGDAVRARNEHRTGHTRLPRYVRGRRGVIHRVLGVHVFPDTHAHGRGEQAQPLYSVRFEASELLSESAEAAAAVYVDLWESYLEPILAG